MLAIDGAAGMAKHRPDIATAIHMCISNNGCAEIHNQFLELGDHTSDELTAALGRAPLRGTILDSYQVSVHRVALICVVSIALVLVACKHETPHAPSLRAVHDEKPAASEPVKTRTETICQSVQQVDFPLADRPTPGQKAGFKSGDSHLHYYGIGTSKDALEARSAAFVELEQGDALVFGGSAVLMMLYANGSGVARNLDLATKLACALEGAPAEVEGRVDHLQTLRSKPGAQPFDLCDDITSGFMQGHCAALASEQREGGRARALDDMTRSWPQTDRDALRKLRAAAEAFWRARGEHEVDLSGTARAALVIEEQTALKEDFQHALEGFERGKLPAHDEPAYRASDETLNRVYKEALSRDSTGSTVDAEGIRATERSWLVYRDAWVRFGAAHYPQVTSETWKTWLNQQRTKQLSELP